MDTPTARHRSPNGRTAAVEAIRAAELVVGHRTRVGAARAIARGIVRVTAGDRGVVLLDDESIRALDAVPPPALRVPTALHVAATWRVHSPEVGSNIGVAGSFVEAALTRRRTTTILWPDPLANPMRPPWPDVVQTTVVPLVVARRVVGVAAAGFTQARRLSRDSLTAMASFGRIAGAALVSAVRDESSARQVIADPLTGLMNRVGFDRRLREELDRGKRANAIPGALVMMDLDNFKQVNDTWGHLVGDAVVRIVANHALRSQIRSYDVACRIGGDEFAVILPHTDLVHAVAVAERIRRAVLDAPTEAVGVPRGTVGASLGVVSFEAGGVGPDAIVARADRHLYGAKRRGRNRVVADDAK